MSKKDQHTIECEASFGTVFELFSRAEMGFDICQILTAKQLTPSEIATLLGIAPSDVSHLMNGHFSRFTTATLLEFLKQLDWKVTIH